jgi:hypothetical protein
MVMLHSKGNLKHTHEDMIGNPCSQKYRPVWHDFRYLCVTSADLPYVALIFLPSTHSKSNCSIILHGHLVICELGSQAKKRVLRIVVGTCISQLVAFYHGLFLSFCLCVIVSSTFVYNYVREF